ncbi:MAG: ParB N-terminal domain-containing protein, partial [Acutalibacteraceae bacterium]
MKKFIIVAISFILILSFSIPCFATTHGNMHEYENHAVYGQYCYSSDPNVNVSTLTNGKYIIETASGLIVTVVPENPNSELLLVVRTIPKTDEAYSWFEKCFQSFDGNIIPLDIYYVDADGNRINIYDDILIEINSNDKVNKVFTLSTDGVVNIVTHLDLRTNIFDIVSGHRRYEACKKLGMKTIPAIFKEMSYDEAVIAMVDSNLQREHILPSEKARALKMKTEAMKRTAGRPSKN